MHFPTNGGSKNFNHAPPQSLPADPGSANGISNPSQTTSEIEKWAELKSLEKEFSVEDHHYLPIGVLGSQAACSEEYLSKLQLLSQHSWIAARTGEISNGIRIYVNTIFTTRTHSQKGIGKLKESLKFVMSKIDPSPDAWNGERDPQPQNRDAVPAAEEESLWHIYNTLKNPNPNAGAMKDPWARRAMEEVLSGGDFTDLGLKTDLFPYQRRSAAMMIQREAQPALMLDPRLQAMETPLGLPYYYDKEEGCIFREKAVYSEACGGKISSLR